MAIPVPDWTKDAACRGLTHVMFPQPWDRAGVAEARRVCAGCGVQVECAVLARRERAGVWAGKLRERPRREGRVA